jgi:rhodanese-related sulfurtransferase
MILAAALDRISRKTFIMKKNVQANPGSKGVLLIGVLAAAVAIVGGALVATNLLSGTNRQPGATVSQGGLIQPSAYVERFQTPNVSHALIDVRTPEEYASGKIRNASNISLQTLQNRLSEIPKDRPIVVYCLSGNRSAQAAALLKSAGYSEVYDLGGITGWQSAGLPVE